MTRKLLIALVTHGIAGLAGFALGIYMLPILIAPDAPAVTAVQSVASSADYSGTFVRDLQDSDALHWGEGTVSIGPKQVVFEGRLAPGPDYQLYFSPEFVETEADFNRLKSSMQWAAPIKTFENFIVDLPADLDPNAFTTVIVWCETFGQFITAARYR